MAMTKEERNEYRRKYRAANTDKIKDRNAKYRAANPEKFKDGNVKYRAANAEKIREREAKNRKELRDPYVRRLLIKAGYPKDSITNGLIEVKQLIIKTRRL